MLQRKAYDELLTWEQRSNGKSALLVEGARRVGKSTLVGEFGKNEQAACLVTDFFQAPQEVKLYFEDYRVDFDTLFLYLSTFYGVELNERNTLVVFDGVQSFPLARGPIKYLVKDGRYDYIETGVASLHTPKRRGRPRIPAVLHGVLSLGARGTIDNRANARPSGSFWHIGSAKNRPL